MKLLILIPAAAIGITGCIALPAALPTSTQVPVSQDPSPPRPFPAGHIVDGKDPSRRRSFLKYPIDGGSPPEKRDPLALSRFPTDGEDVANDPSPPSPFPAGRIVDGKDPSPPRPFPKYPLDGENVANDPSPPRPFPPGRWVYTEGPPPPLEGRDPRAPHKLVPIDTKTTDPSPPRPFPKYALDGGNPLEERDPLSRFPTNGEAVANDPSPPMPFPAGRLVETEESSPRGTIESRSPSPLLRTPEGSEAEANDPSPPRPFPAGRLVETEESSPSETIVPRSPSPLLPITEGSEAEANDPSPPQPFPAGHPEDKEPQAGWPLVKPFSWLPWEAFIPYTTPVNNVPVGYSPWFPWWSRPYPPVSKEVVDVEAPGELPPHHGGYFPPSNPPVSEPTAPANAIEARGEVPSPPKGHSPLSNPPAPEPTAPAVKAFVIPTGNDCSYDCPPDMFDCCWGPYTNDLPIDTFTVGPDPTSTAWRPERPDGLPIDTYFTLGPEYFPTGPDPTTISTATPTPAPGRDDSHGRRQSPRTTFDTSTKPRTVRPDALPTPTAAIDPAPNATVKAMGLPPHCTTTFTSFHLQRLDLTGATTAYAATVTSPVSLDCHACKLAITTVDVGNGPAVMETARPTVTDSGTATEYTAVCSFSLIL